MAEREPYRVAIIGAGIGGEHVTGYLELQDRFQVATVCDLDGHRAAALASRVPGCAAATDLDAVVADGGIDIVDICLPPNLHCPVTLKSLEAGKHVICEKPLACSLADADRIIEAAARAGTYVLPVFQYRYGRGFGQLLRLIGSGICGKPLTATLETHWNRGADYYSVPWRGTWEGESGGAILGHAIHIHDLLCTALGPVETVSALLATRANRIEVDDCAAIAFGMQCGALVTSSVTLGSAEDMSRLRFCFENLTAESGRSPYHPAGAGWTFQARGAVSQADIDAAVAGYGRPEERFAGLFAEFAKQLRGKTSAAVSLGDGRRSIELVTAIYQAARSGQPVRLPISADCELYRGWSPPAV